jgi:hypothetical protein
MPLIPAEAGTQVSTDTLPAKELGPGLRWDERIKI